MSNFKMQGGPISFRRPWLHKCKCWRIHVMAYIFRRFKLRVEVSDNEIRSCIWPLVIAITESKTRSNTFLSFSDAQACWIWPNGDVNVSSPSQNFLFDNSGVPQILRILPLSAASAAALNVNRIFLFLYSFKTK